MSDAVIAEIGRRVAVHASRAGYERSQDEKVALARALTELCAAVKAEQDEEPKP